MVIPNPLWNIVCFLALKLPVGSSLYHRPLTGSRVANPEPTSGVLSIPFLSFKTSLPLVTQSIYI